MLSSGSDVRTSGARNAATSRFHGAALAALLLAVPACGQTGLGNNFVFYDQTDVGYEATRILP